MSSEPRFIFMLTRNDRTVPDAAERLEEVLAGGGRDVGFKDHGLGWQEVRRLAAALSRLVGSHMCWSHRLLARRGAAPRARASGASQRCGDTLVRSGHCARVPRRPVSTLYFEATRHIRSGRQEWAKYVIGS